MEGAESKARKAVVVKKPTTEEEAQ
jgi:hypothetical protein